MLTAKLRNRVALGRGVRRLSFQISPTYTYCSTEKTSRSKVSSLSGENALENSLPELSKEMLGDTWWWVGDVGKKNLAKARGSLRTKDSLTGSLLQATAGHRRKRCPRVHPA